jgi:hypothetical protein
MNFVRKIMEIRRLSDSAKENKAHGNQHKRGIREVGEKW